LDDQLVLGIKGTLSVVELKVMRQRLLAGQEAKARRGELFKRLPVGYARDPVGKIMFHPGLPLALRRPAARTSVGRRRRWLEILATRSVQDAATGPWLGLT